MSSILYRALLRLYPRSFRESYGDEMVEVFESRLAGRSMLGRLGTLLTAIADAAIAAAVRRIVRAVDPDQPVSRVRRLEEVVAGETASRRAQLYVLGALTGVALLLSVVGIHGLLAYAVAQRAREIGVRLALGAKPRGVAWMVVREGLVAAAIGVPVGVVVATLAGRSLQALLFGVPPADLATIAGASVLVLLATLIGSLAPARRALGVSPMLAMRGE